MAMLNLPTEQILQTECPSMLIYALLIDLYSVNYGPLLLHMKSSALEQQSTKSKLWIGTNTV